MNTWIGLVKDDKDDWNRMINCNKSSQVYTFTTGKMEECRIALHFLRSLMRSYRVASIVIRSESCFEVH